ncbi:unnamed protein product [Timema podura]|uniref:Uncharacterized protein n=1 Tax=Timema podura TaxID=61482 RepID=A0ABN7PRW6_TIMPD|nr:unnamed protein product [Timema podura]
MPMRSYIWQSSPCMHQYDQVLDTTCGLLSNNNQLEKEKVARAATVGGS